MARLMQDWSLRVMRLLDHAEREYPDQQIVTHWADGHETRGTWRDVAHDARRLAQALVRLGVNPGDRVATLAMNHQHHLTSWYGTIGMGGVIHTINPRLFAEQLGYIVNHADDVVMLYDKVFLPIIDGLRAHWPTVRHFICFDDPDGFEALIALEDGVFDWVDGDERDPCMICYTSGTTGNPKGVVYEHRSTVLHAMCEIAPDSFDLSALAVVMPIVPMFHAASWGLPFAAPAAGCKLVFSAVNEPVVWHRMMMAEGVTHSAGVPTVWLGMFAFQDATGAGLGKLRLATIGGAAAPRAMIERLMKQGVRVSHAWGMTETSPIGTIGAPRAGWDDLSFEEQVDITARQGRPPFGIELQTVDDNGAVLPRDGQTSGALHIRGPWVVKRYFRADADATDGDQWFDSGDIGVIHPDGTLQLTDRAKDIIKSGGEWISSVDLENAAMGCAGVAEAAAIGVYHPKWDERPILIVVRRPGATVTADEIKACLAGVVAKWWLPDAIEFVDVLPHTATGKILKSALREQYKDYTLDQ